MPTLTSRSQASAVAMTEHTASPRTTNPAQASEGTPSSHRLIRSLPVVTFAKTLSFSKPILIPLPGLCLALMRPIPRFSPVIGRVALSLL